MGGCVSKQVVATVYDVNNIDVTSEPEHVADVPVPVYITVKPCNSKSITHLLLKSPKDRPATYGVSAEFVKMFRYEYYQTGMTTKDMHKQILAITKEHKCSLVSLLDSPSCGPGTVFVSHAYSYDFNDVVEVMLMYEESHAGSYFWFDPISVNQQTDGSGRVNKKTDILEKLFCDQIQIIGKTLIVASPWDNPQFLSRIWCLFELYKTVERGVDMFIYLPSRQRELFIKSTIENPQFWQNIIARVDVRTAKASEPADQDAILRLIDRTVTAEGLNKIVLSRMREWVAYSIIEEEDRILRSEGDTIYLAFYRGATSLTLQQLGHLDNAENFSLKCLSSRTRLLEANHDDTIAAAINHSNVLYAQRKLEEATLFARDALKRSELKHGPVSESAVISASHLGLILKDMAKFDEAFVLTERCLKYRQQHSKGHDVNLMNALTNHGGILQELDKSTEALELLEKALVISEAVNGDTHESSLNVSKSIAGIYRTNREYGEAERIIRRVMKAYDTSYGDEHQYTVECVNDFALILMNQDKDDEAEKYFKQALAKYDIIYKGEDHVHMMSTVANLGFLAMKRQNYVEAERYMLRDLECTARVSGEAHPDTVSGLGNLAALYEKQELYEKADKCFKRQLKGAEEIWGVSKKSVIKIRANMAKNELSLLMDKNERGTNGVHGVSRFAVVIEELNSHIQLLRETHAVPANSKLIVGYQMAVDNATQSCCFITQ